MSKIKYDAIANLTPGRYDYKIRARVTRKWRITTKTGDEMKGFNIILIEETKKRIHAFIPAFCADDLETKLETGNVCSIKNFTVQMYKTSDIFRCLKNNKQLIFSKDTDVELEEDNGKIPHEVFDFYDHTELKDFAKQNTYLADLVGIINKHDGLKEFTNKKGQPQTQSKFNITDGSSNIKVTFWDKFGEIFEKSLAQTTDEPVIIIIANCRVGLWNEKVDISNVAATKFYLNYNHHSVIHLRKMLNNPEFKNKVFQMKNNKITKLLTIEEIIKLGKEDIETQVLTHVNITSVFDKKKWFFNACTNCHTETVLENGFLTCPMCPRVVPHTDKMYRLSCVASDETGRIEIILEDREVRALIGKRARKLYDEHGKNRSLPNCLKNIVNTNYSVLLQIKEMNVVENIKVYTATNICYGYKQPPVQDTMQQTNSQATTSTYNLHGLSNLQFNST